MSKVTTINMDTALAKQFANEPLFVLMIEWGENVGTKYYSEKTISPNILGKILRIDDLSITRQEDNYGAIGQFNVELDDCDKHFWTIMNLQNIEGKKVTVYQAFDSMDQADWLTLFTGNVVGPINWSEGQHVISFSVFSNYGGDNLFGMVIPDFTDITTPANLPNSVDIQDPSSIGKFVPIVFGNCICTPAVRVASGMESTTLGLLHFDDALYNEDLSSYISQTVLVEDGYKFPQFKEMIANIGGVRCRGEFGPEGSSTFFISEHNVPTDLANAATYRDTGDPDYYNYTVCWIDTTEILVEKWVLFFDPHSGFIANYCTAQDGQKCTFALPFSRQYPDYTNGNPPGPFLMLLNGVTALQSATKYSYKWPALIGQNFYEVWDIPPGSEFSVEAADVYIANYIASTNIKGVYAYRNVKKVLLNPITGDYEDKGSKRTLCPVPSSYYTKNLTYAFNGVTMSAIVFNRPLKTYPDQGWEDEIFIVQSSPQGPNTSDEIKWLIQTWTPSITVDATSFNAVKTLLAKYPSNFPLLTQGKTLDICRQIAWQARCALTIYNNVAYLTYLSVAPTSIQDIQTPDIQYKSIDITYTDSERMYTSITGKYRFNFTAPELKAYYKNNVDKYGLKEVTWDFFIYNNGSYVSKSLKFWGRYYSESWKKMKLNSFLNALKLDLFDCTQFTFPTDYPMGLTTFKGIVEEWDYNSESFLTNMMIWTAILAGTTVEDNTFWLDDSGDPAAFDPTAGIAEFDYVVPLNLTRKQQPAQYGVVTAITPELDTDGNATGVNIFTVDSTDYGYENFVGDTITNTRKLDPDSDDFLVGDKVRLNTLIGKTYAEPLVPTGPTGEVQLAVVRTDSNQGKASLYLVDVYGPALADLGSPPTIINQIVSQTPATYPFFAGELVGILRTESGYLITKFNSTSVAGEVEDGDLYVRLCASTSGSGETNSTVSINGRTVQLSNIVGDYKQFMNISNSDSGYGYTAVANQTFAGIVPTFKTALIPIPKFSVYTTVTILSAPTETINNLLHNPTSLSISGHACPYRTGFYQFWEWPAGPRNGTYGSGSINTTNVAVYQNALDQSIFGGVQSTYGIGVKATASALVTTFVADTNTGTVDSGAGAKTLPSTYSAGFSFAGTYSEGATGSSITIT